jgi:hypothetical protein
MRIRMRITGLLAAVMLLAWGGTAIAAAPAWNELSTEQQAVLESVRDRWDTLPEARRETLLRGAERWQQMTPEARDNARARLDRWRQLDARQRRN